MKEILYPPENAIFATPATDFERANGIMTKPLQQSIIKSPETIFRRPWTKLEDAMTELSKISVTCAILLAATPTFAQDSLRASGNASAGSIASMAVVSISTASVLTLTAHAGASMVVESFRTIGNVVEIVLHGTANASRAVFSVPAAAANNVALTKGQTVRIVPEGNGQLLVAAGKVLCFVPGTGDEQIVRSRRSL